MKKITALFLSALLLVSFVGCGKKVDTNSSSSSSLSAAENSNSSIEGTDLSSEIGSASDTANTASNNQTTVGTSSSGSKKPTNNSSSKKPGATTNNNQTTNTGTSTTITPPIVAYTAHTPLAADKYYHYSTLNAKQKRIYNDIISAIKNLNNVIDVSSYGISRDEGQLILQMAIADHPEYFYVSKYTSTSYNTSTNILSALYLYYTDGVTVDTLDEQHNLIHAASRTNIANEIQALNRKTEGILKLISGSATPLAKEKFIHDYLVTHVTFDKKAASSASFTFGEVLPHDWDVYGALIEGLAVCEGYAKAFSYLCHCVGINATTVLGATSEGDHMWDEVNINGKWYLVDVAWDDMDQTGDLSGLKGYEYFNITTSGLSTHVPSTIMVYPSATGTENAYKNTYAINMENGSLSSNYKFVIDEMVKEKERFLQIYTGSNNLSSSVLSSTFFSADSAVQKYIKEKGYRMKIEPRTFGYGHYTCLLVSYY